MDAIEILANIVGDCQQRGQDSDTPEGAGDMLFWLWPVIDRLLEAAGADERQRFIDKVVRHHGEGNPDDNGRECTA